MRVLRIIELDDQIFVFNSVTCQCCELFPAFDGGVLYCAMRQESDWHDAVREKNRRAKVVDPVW